MDIESFAIGLKVGAKSGGGGSSGGVLVVHADMQTGALNKTWQEINDADFAVISFQMDEYNKYVMPVVYIVNDAGQSYQITALKYDDSLEAAAFSADSATGYPVWTDPNA